MQRANRHVEGLEFFQGYRSANNEEKVIDVALGVDLIAGIAYGRFDRVDLVGGDGDHLYVAKTAHAILGNRLRVHLAPGQYLSELGKERIAFTRWSREEFIALGIESKGRDSPVPEAAAAPANALWTVPILTGPFGKQAASPAP